MPVLYVVTNNSAIRANEGWNGKGIYMWPGDNNYAGFYVTQAEDGNFTLVYVEKPGGKVYVSVSYRIPWDTDGYVIEMLLGYSGWQCDPETGERIMYRILDPFEYVFGSDIFP